MKPNSSMADKCSHSPMVHCSKCHIRPHPEIVMSGYLVKSPPLNKSMLVKRWMKRYFVLRANCRLEYYRDAKSVDPLTVINLEQTLRIEAGLETKKYANIFDLILPGRTYFFSAGHIELMFEWVRQIKRLLGIEEEVVYPQKNTSKPLTPGDPLLQCYINQSRGMEGRGMEGRTGGERGEGQTGGERGMEGRTGGERGEGRTGGERGEGRTGGERGMEGRTGGERGEGRTGGERGEGRTGGERGEGRSSTDSEEEGPRSPEEVQKLQKDEAEFRASLVRSNHYSVVSRDKIGAEMADFDTTAVLDPGPQWNERKDSFNKFKGFLKSTSSAVTSLNQSPETRFYSEPSSQSLPEYAAVRKDKIGPSKELARLKSVGESYESAPPPIPPKMRTLSHQPPKFQPSYNPEQTPTYNPEQTPTYKPEQTPTYNPEQTPTYKPEQTPTYNPEQTPTYKPEQTSTYNPEPMADTEISESDFGFQRRLPSLSRMGKIKVSSSTKEGVARFSKGRLECDTLGGNDNEVVCFGTIVKKVFGAQGGRISFRESKTEVLVPSGAIPTGHIQGFYFKVSADSGFLEECGVAGDTSHVCSPLLQFGPVGAKFDEPIRIQMPHCLNLGVDDYEVQLILAYDLYSPNGAKFLRIPASKEDFELEMFSFNTILGPVVFNLQPDHVTLEISHFVFQWVQLVALSKPRPGREALTVSKRFRLACFISAASAAKTFLTTFLYNDYSDVLTKLKENQSEKEAFLLDTSEPLFLPVCHADLKAQISLDDLEFGFKVYGRNKMSLKVPSKDCASEMCEFEIQKLFDNTKPFSCELELKINGKVVTSLDLEADTNSVPHIKSEPHSTSRSQLLADTLGVSGGHTAPLGVLAEAGRKLGCELDQVSEALKQLDAAELISSPKH